MTPPKEKKEVLKNRRGSRNVKKVIFVSHFKVQRLISFATNMAVLCARVNLPLTLRV